MKTTMLATRQLVIVNRSIMEQIPVTVYAHEVPCLEIVNGEGSVTVVSDVPEGSDPKLFTETVELGVDEEWARLQNVYGNHPDMGLPVVDFVYQSQKDNLQQAGAKGAATTKSNPGNNDKLTIAEITKRLDSLSVDYPSNANKAVLMELLRSSVIDYLMESDEDVDQDADIDVLWSQLDTVLSASV